MIVIWENKGFLVLLYIVFSLIGTVFICQYLGEKSEWDLFINRRMFLVFGLPFMIAALPTYLSKNDYYKDRDGNKVKMDSDNSFFFIKMEYWPYILLGIGMLFMIGSIL